jgi:D-alanyl-D-alanine carboxypeptidase (penicillin-binding protein 5/6)
MELVFQALKEGKLKLDQELLISPNAWRTGGAPSGGSTMFASVNSHIKVEDLIQGAIVASGNDAAIAFAEALDGSESAFAEHMTRRAHELGLETASFKNATGLDAPDHKISVRDLALLTAHIIRTYPEFFKYYSQRDFTWNKITQRNRNPLLDLDIGADGMKTGYTKESGYGLVGTAMQNGLRLIVVVNGAPSLKERADDAKKLLEWGFRSFDPKPLVTADQVVAEARVFGGDARYVPLKAAKALRIFTPHGANSRLLIRVVYTGPLRAPIAKGAQVARLKVWRDKRLVLDAPLLAAADVGGGGLVRRAADGAYELAVDLVRLALSKLKRS